MGLSILLAGMAICAPAATVAKKPTTKAAPSTSKAPAAAKTSNTAKKSSSRKKSKKTASWRRRGQQKIDGQRAREIQQALIREHYLDGTASGVWDDASQKAMERFQADNGWQSKMIPDSRALIKLGLGPDHEHLLNPESAMTTLPVSSPAKDAANTTPPQN